MNNLKCQRIYTLLFGVRVNNLYFEVIVKIINAIKLDIGLAVHKVEWNVYLLLVFKYVYFAISFPINVVYLLLSQQVKEPCVFQHQVLS